MSKSLVFTYLFLAISTWVYSYGFVDFNLTLSSHPYVLSFVSLVQQLALFNRPLSLLFYLILISAFFGIYYFVLAHPPKSTPWKLLVILGLIFSLSYPLLSSDVFKYLFSAKTVIEYGANPHLVAPQVFEGDLWLRFMRWIHTPSPYGPLQTALAIPYYLLGFGKFVPVLYLYKLDQLFWYLLAVWAIGKLGGSSRARLFFALNPLVLLEWLVNAHNDAPMISLALLSLVLFYSQKRFLSALALLSSIGIKFVTVIFLPLFVLPKLQVQKLALIISALLAVIPLVYHYNVQYQPWYVTWIIPFVALLPSRRLWWIVAAYSFGALLRYIPFVQTGLWQGSASYFAALTFLPPFLTALGYNYFHATLSSSKKV